MTCKATVVIFAILFLLLCSTSVGGAKVQKMSGTAKVHHALSHNNHETSISPSQKIESLVMLAQPQKGKAYARSISKAICRESQRNNVPPLAVAATGYIESEFSMKARPCVGIMQVHPPTYREMCRKTDKDLRGADLMDVDDNIRVGTREFSRNYHSKLASRGGESWRLSYAWGRYNGCGPNGSYVSRAKRVYSRLENGSPEEWAKHLKKKPLWRS